MKKELKAGLQNRLSKALLSEFANQPEVVQDEVLNELQKVQARSSGEFFCTTLKCNITVPCQAENCNYYTSPGRTSHNCLLKHKFDNGNSALSIDEISEITDIPESRIRASIEHSFNKVRAHTLLSDINSGNFNRFTYFGGASVCVVCGSITPKKAFSVDKNSNLFYCSRACYKKKPPSLIRLEIFYRCDIRIILQVAKKVLKRLPLIASALDVKRRLLLKWYDCFLGMHPSVFGTEAVGLADIMRRSMPKTSWALDFLNSTYNKPGVSVNQKMLDLEQECLKMCKTL
jgi:hypothetical protein